MKLKKIASLMLAGVMAVSMLAGCSNGTKPDDDKKDPVVNTGMTGKVIAALDEDTTEKVAFSSSSSLESALQKAVKNAGSDFSNLDTFGQNVWNQLQKIDTDLKNDAFTGGSVDNVKKEQSYTRVFWLDSSYIGVSADYAAKAMAKMVAATEPDGENVLADLTDYSADYTDPDDKDKECWYNFDYTADIAVVEVTNAVNGQSAFVGAVTITRTGTYDSKDAK